MLSVAVALAFGHQMYGNSDQKVREEIQATYDGYSKAVLGKDLDKTMSFLTSDIVWVYPGGKEQHRDEIRTAMKQWEDSITSGTKIHFVIDKLKIDSDSKIEAYVTMHYMSPEMKSANKPEGLSKWHDTWVKNNDRWQNSRGEELPMKKAN